MKIKSAQKRGFSLIELLVVIAIIAILTAIVTSNFTQSKARSRDAKRISDIAQLQLTLALFFDRCNAYPTTLDLNFICPTLGTVKVSNYISRLPTDPTTLAPYIYAKGSTEDYVLKATLESQSSALSDDIDGTVFGLECETNGPNERAYCVKPN